MNPRTVVHNGSGIIFGLILLAVGGYYFLRNTLGFNLGPLDGEAIWPIIVVALGVWLVLRNLLERSDPGQRG